MTIAATALAINDEMAAAVTVETGSQTHTRNVACHGAFASPPVHPHPTPRNAANLAAEMFEGRITDPMPSRR